MTQTIERRFSSSPAKLVSLNKQAGSGQTIRGYAALFSSRSVNLGTIVTPLYEIIEPGAFDRVNLNGVVALFNHDTNLILARSGLVNGTLRLGIDSKGLWFEFVCPETSYGQDLLISMRRGDVSQCSFAFVLSAGGDVISRQADGSILRRIKRIAELHDVSVVASPAYSDTTAEIGKNSFTPATGVSSTPERNLWAARLGIK